MIRKRRWTDGTYAAKVTMKEPTPARHAALIATTHAAEVAIASGTCPVDGLPLVSGSCSCGFTLKVLPPYVPPRVTSAGFNRRCQSSSRLPQIGPP